MQYIWEIRQTIISQPNSLTNIKTNKGYKVICNSPNHTMAQNPIYLLLGLPINND